MRFGIRIKLTLAFGIISILAVTAGMVGWFGFGRIADNQRVIIQNSIPAMVNAQNLAEAAAKIVATAPNLVAAKNQEERHLAIDKLKKYRSELLVNLGNLAKNGFDYETVTTLSSMAGHLLANLKQQEELIVERSGISRRRDVVSTELHNAVAAIKPYLNSRFSSYSEFQKENLPHDMEQEGGGEKQQLSENDLATIRIKTTKLGILINQLSRETDLIVMNFIQSEFLSDLEILQEKVAKLKNPVIKRAIEEQLELISIDSKPAGSRNVFDINRALRRVNTELTGLESQNREIAIKLHSKIGDLMQKGSDAINHEMLLSKDALILGRNVFIAVTIGTVLFIAFILWFYVRGAVRRLLALESGMRQLAQGNYDIDLDVSEHGHDELAVMAQTVQAFRKNSIERERLQKEQVEAEKVLRQHKYNLEKLVDARTKEVQDVNRELAEKAIKHLEAREAAERASQVKTDFLATMSHELRTPMSGLLGVINLIKDTAPSKQQAEYLDTLEVIANTLLEILDDILGYSQIEAGKLTLNNADFDIHNVIEDMIEVLKPVANKKDIYLTADIDPVVPHMLYGDAGKLRQILLNIIGNGIKFTNKGGVHLKVVRQPYTQNSDVKLLFEIEDTGIGIPKKIQKNVFEAFNQGVTSISQQYGGTGLGLAICKRLITLMGGEIRCDSTVGVGSVFSFKLVFKESCTLDAKVDDLKALPGWGSVSELRVLLVEDDPTNRMVLRSYLEKTAHSVTEVADGEQAVLMATDNDFDVILMDLRMPKLNGVEAAKRIRALSGSRSSVPIIAISAHTNPNKVDDYMGAGMNGFIAKPVNPAKLNEVLYQVVVEKSDIVPRAPSEIGLHSTEESCYELLLQDIEFIGVDKTSAKIDLFLSSSHQTVDEIKEAVRNKNKEALREFMHKLKGASAAVGLYSLSSHAGELEALAFNETEDLVNEIEKFETLYDLSCDLLVKSFEKARSDLHS